MSTFVCTEGHDFLAPQAPRACPYCPAGKPCPGQVQTPAQRVPVVQTDFILEAVKAGAELEVQFTGRWYRVDSARPLRRKVEVRFTTGTGPRLKVVPTAALRVA